MPQELPRDNLQNAPWKTQPRELAMAQVWPKTTPPSLLAAGETAPCRVPLCAPTGLDPRLLLGGESGTEKAGRRPTPVLHICILSWRHWGCGSYIRSFPLCRLGAKPGNLGSSVALGHLSPPEHPLSGAVHLCCCVRRGSHGGEAGPRGRGGRG